MKEILPSQSGGQKPNIKILVGSVSGHSMKVPTQQPHTLELKQSLHPLPPLSSNWELSFYIQI